MSHFIGFVFVDENYNTLENVLAPYNERDEDFFQFDDKTDEVVEKFNSLPDKDERVDENGKPYPYPCDRENYPTIDSLAKDWFGYTKQTDENGSVRYGFMTNPNAKWDWYSEGGRWDSPLIRDNGDRANILFFDEVDWDKMIESFIPFCFVDTDGEWHERANMGWWGMTSNEKDTDEWADMFKDYIAELRSLDSETQSEIAVYAIDFHI